MLQSKFSHSLTLFQKIKNYDFILLMSILILGIISIFTMYSTDGGEILFHTTSPLTRLTRIQRALCGAAVTTACCAILENSRVLMKFANNWRKLKLN